MMSSIANIIIHDMKYFKSLSPHGKAIVIIRPKYFTKNQSNSQINRD